MSKLKEAFQRFLSIALSVTTTVWLSGITLLLPVSPALAVAPSAYGLTEGNLVRAPSKPAPEGWAVYIVNAAGYKRHIFNPDVFKMYGHLHWSNVKDLSASTVDAFATSDLYRVAGDTKVWSTGSDGVRHWINMTADQFSAQGYNWGQVFVINATEGNYYTQGSDITTGTPPPPPAQTGGALNVALSPNNPPSGVIAAGSIFNRMLALRFTAGAQAQTISGLVVTKSGLIANTNVTSISIWNGNTRISNVLTALTSDGKASFTFTTPVSIPANGSVDLDVKIGISSTATSGTLSWMVNSANDITSSVAATGVFPTSGNTFSIIASGQIGAYTISAQSVGGSSGFPVSGSGNLEIGTVTQKELGRFQISETSGNEDLSFQQMTVYLEGSTQLGDFTNWKVYDLSGTLLGTGTVTMPYVYFTFGTPYKIPSGSNRTFSVKADPVTGADRTVRVHIQNSYDLTIQGSLTGSFIAASSFADTAGSDGYWRLKQGALTVSLTSGSSSGNIAVGAQDAVLAQFDLRASGETLEIRKMDLEIVEAVSTSSQLLTGNVKVQSNDGNTTYLSLAASTASLQRQTDTPDTVRFDLNNYLVIPAGATQTIRVLGTVPTTAVGSQTYKAKVGYFYAYRRSTQDFLDLLSNNYTSGNILTVQTSALTVAQNPAVANKTVAAGANNVVVGSFVLQSGSAEGVTVSGLGIYYPQNNSTFPGTGTASNDLTNVTVCLNNGATSGTGSCPNGPQFGTTIGTPSSASDSFNGSFTIPANGTQVVEVRANIKTGVTSSNTMIMYIGSVSATGLTTSNSITAAAVGGTAVSATAPIGGQTFTYGTGTLTIAKEGSPTTKIVIAGTTGVQLDRVRFTALNDNLTLQKIRFRTTTNGSSTSVSTTKYISKAYLYDGTTNLTPAGVSPVPNGNSAEMLFSGLNYSLPAGSNKYLTLVVDLSGYSAITAAADVATFAVSVKSNSTTDDLQVVGTQGNLGASSINSAAATDLAASDVFLFHAAAPVITVSSTPSGTQSPQTNQSVFTFTVKSAGPGISLRIPRVRVRVSLAQVNGWTGSLGTWDLYDGSTRIASNTSLTLTSTTSSGVLTFDGTNEVSTGFTSGYSSTDLTNGTYGRVCSDVTGCTFTVKVDTSTIRSSSSSTPGTATLTFKVDGLTGYSTATGTSSDPNDSAATATGASSAEDNWTGGGMFYAYALYNSATYIGGTAVANTSTAVGDTAFNASDSYPAVGSTLSY